MDAAYIEALNTGFLRDRASKGAVRDPFLLSEIDRLNEIRASEGADSSPEVAPARVQVTTTIPPPSWKRA